MLSQRPGFVKTMDKEPAGALGGPPGFRPDGRPADVSMASAGPGFQAGLNSKDDGWVAYAHNGVLLVRASSRSPGSRIRTSAAMPRQTSGALRGAGAALGLLVGIDPGLSAVLVERWQVAEADRSAGGSAQLRRGSGRSRTPHRPRPRRDRAGRSRCVPGGGVSGSGRAQRRGPVSRTGHARGSPC